MINRLIELIKRNGPTKEELNSAKILQRVEYPRESVDFVLVNVLGVKTNA